jgi:hypothetical protein
MVYGMKSRDAAEPVHRHHQPGAAAGRVPQRLLPGPLCHAGASLCGLLPRHGPAQGHCHRVVAARTGSGGGQLDGGGGRCGSPRLCGWGCAGGTAKMKSLRACVS